MISSQEIVTNETLANHPALAGLLYNDEAHTYHVDQRQLPSVTDVLSNLGLSDFSKVPKDVLEFARIRGTAVHLATAFFDEGVLNREQLDPNIVPFLESYERFRDAMGDDYVPGVIELPAFDPVWLYAGKPDRVAYVNGVRSIVDIKTNRNSMKATRIQTAAYKEMHRNLFPDLPEPERRFELKLHREGKMAELIEFEDDEQDQADWFSCLRVYYIKQGD